METTKKYRRGYEPADWVKRFAHLIPRGPVLDLACGKGRNGRFLLGPEHDVTFVDRDVSGLWDLEGEKGAVILSRDLEGGAPWPFEREAFAGILVVNYLHRPLFPHLIASLKPRGLLIHSTFARGNEKYGRPRNPDFLLEKDELMEVYGAAMEVIEFTQGTRRDPPRVVQSICARKPGPRC